MTKTNPEVTPKNAKKSSAAKPAKTNAPSELILHLHAPQMDAMLRAGIGGLASVLQHMQNAAHAKKSTDSFPLGPWQDANPPWSIETDRITLRFGKPENAFEYLKRLFEYAFRIEPTDNVIDLPATYEQQNRIVRAHLQRGLMLTFLQHGQSRSGAKKDTDKFFEIEGKQFPYSLRELTSYKHQTGYTELADKTRGTLSEKLSELPGTLYPGAAVRHNKFNSHTKHEGTVAELLAAYFALVGTIALPVNRGSAVLLVPEVVDLIAFGKRRYKITPERYRDCLITGVGDAVLNIYANLVGEDKKRKLQVPAISAYLFQPTAWASQQKSRVAGTRIEPLSPEAETIFDFTRQFFPPRIKVRTEKISAGKGRSKTAHEIEQPFWSLSIVRPLIADNLANRKPWFHDFSSLFTRNDPATGNPSASTNGETLNSKAGPTKRGRRSSTTICSDSCEPMLQKPKPVMTQQNKKLVQLSGISSSRLSEVCRHQLPQIISWRCT